MLSALTRPSPTVGSRVLVQIAVLLIESGSDLSGPRVEYAGIGFSIEQREITHTIERGYTLMADRTPHADLLAIETRATITQCVGRAGYLVRIGCATIPMHSSQVRVLESEARA